MASKGKGKSKPGTSNPKKQINEMKYVWYGVAIAAVLTVAIIAIIIIGNKRAADFNRGRTSYEKLLTEYFGAVEKNNQRTMEALHHPNLVTMINYASSEEGVSFLEFGDAFYPYYGSKILSYTIGTPTETTPDFHEYLNLYFALTPEQSLNINTTMSIRTPQGEELTLDMGAVVICIEGRWYVCDFELNGDPSQTVQP